MSESKQKLPVFSEISSMATVRALVCSENILPESREFTILSGAVYITEYPKK